MLVDSHALTIFRVTGSATVRLGWGSPSYVVFAVGGFYPGFRPEPANIPPQQRLGLALDIPCPLSFRASGYLAITSNSFQAGADIEVGIDLDVISASGFLRFDAIIQFDPFHLHADYSAGWEVEVAIFSGGTTVSGWIDGPGPWAVHAEVSISLLIDDFTWSDTFHFGPSGPPPNPPLEHAVDVLAADARRRLAHPVHRRGRSACLDPAAQGRRGEGPRRVLAARRPLVDADGAAARAFRSRAPAAGASPRRRRSTSRSTPRSRSRRRRRRRTTGSRRARSRTSPRPRR